MEIQTITLKSIKGRGCFRLSFPLRPELYERLERRLPGLPLLVVDQAGRLVFGHDYLPVLEKQRRIKAKVLRLDIDRLDGLCLNFNLKATLTGVNLFEKLHLVYLALPLTDLAQIRRRVDLDLPKAETWTERLQELHVKPIPDLLAGEHATLATAVKLFSFPPRDRRPLLKMLAAWKFTTSEQLRLLELLEEIMFRDKCSLHGVMRRAGIERLINSQMPQGRIIAALAALRYPTLTRKEKEWRAMLQKNQVPASVRISHSPNFEKSSVEVTMRVADVHAALALIRNLDKNDVPD